MKYYYLKYVHLINAVNGNFTFYRKSGLSENRITTIFLTWKLYDYIV